MKFLSVILSVLIVTGFLFVGCNDSKSPNESMVPQITKALSAETTSSANFPTSVVLAGFTVTYNGRTLANNQTTFAYTVTGGTSKLSFRLEDPSCGGGAFSWSPTNGAEGSNDADINPGIEWNPNVGPGSTTTYTFTVTYPGTVKQGVILTKVKTTSTSAVGFITGPCARVFDISGSVYTDGNSNGLREVTETGNLNVTVSLYNTTGLLESQTTDASGNYIFHDYFSGPYTVKVDTNSVAGTGTRYLGATSATQLNVTVGPNSTGNNFGFAPLSNKLINDLKLGTLPTTGFNPGFWKKQLSSAISGSGNPTVTKAQLQGYVVAIRGLLLTDPFALPNGDGLQDALNILSKPIKSDLDALQQQLLALEFNHVSNHGIVSTDQTLQLDLIGWGEGIIAGGVTTAAAPIDIRTTSTTATTATTVYSGINKSSGGGGGF
jgi:hypothetical protein